MQWPEQGEGGTCAFCFRMQPQRSLIKYKVMNSKSLDAKNSWLMNWMPNM
jgi:hypothetical protein